MDLIFDTANRPFAVAIGVVLALAALEVAFLLVGTGLSSLLDSIVPDVEFGVDGGGATPLGNALSFFGIGSVPLLVVLISFLTIFGLSGYILQGAVGAVSSSYLPALIASLPALVVAVLGTRRLAGSLARLFPNVETTAVSSNTFVGRTATVTVGEARADQPAEARFRDQHGQMHYVLVEPDIAGTTLAAGDLVLLVGRRQNIFLAIPAPDSLRKSS